MKTLIAILAVTTLCVLANADSIPMLHMQRMQRISQKYCDSDSNDLMLSIRTEDDGSTYLYVVTKQRYKATPEWNGQGEPPLPLPKAIEIAKNFLRNRIQNNSRLQLSSVSLGQKAQVGEFKDKWHYTLGFEERSADSEDRDIRGWTVLLLMDGSEVTPVKWQDDEELRTNPSTTTK